MSRSRQPGDGQKPLMVTHDATQRISSEALPTVPEAASVDRIEHAVHLSAVLVRFDVMPGQEDWLQAAQRPNSALHRNLFSSSHEKANDMIGGRQKAYDTTKSEALDLFGRAFGEHALVDTGLASAEEASQLKLADYRKFEAHFRGSGSIRVARRAAYRNYLGGLVASSRVEAPTPETAQPVNLTAKVSLARMLRPDFQGLKASRYEDLTYRDLASFRPSSIRKQLLYVGSQTPNAIGYLRDGETRPTFIVQSPEAIKISRSIPKLAEAAVNASEKKRHGVARSSADQDAPRRAGIHAVESRRLSIEKYQRNVIDRSLALIGQFEEAIGHNAGLARFGSEAKARQKLTELQTGTFDEMLWTAAINQNLSPADRDRMRRSVEKAIYFAPTATARRSNFAAFLSLARDWRQAQAECFTTLVLTCDNYLNKHRTDADTISPTT